MRRGGGLPVGFGLSVLDEPVDLLHGRPEVLELGVNIAVVHLRRRVTADLHPDRLGNIGPHRIGFERVPEAVWCETILHLPAIGQADFRAGRPHVRDKLVLASIGEAINPPIQVPLTEENSLPVPQGFNRKWFLGLFAKSVVDSPRR